MSMPLPERDERAILVENASYRWAYLVQAFGILGIVGYRSLKAHEQSWDLLTLLLVAGLTAAAYQGFHRVQGRRWATATAVTLIAAALMAWLLTAPRS